mmetsp:Transcript_66729/g.77449  ORF Transcript_66729/g.77449 Transcript_66729/m.77449 type:complete len:150 (+) Transcript_66729:42-491(+)
MNKLTIFVLLGLVAIASAGSFRGPVIQSGPVRMDVPEALRDLKNVDIPMNNTEAVELLVQHLFKNGTSLKDAANTLQIIGELFLATSQCSQDLGGAFYMASNIAADAAAGWKDIQGDVMSTIFTGVIGYKAVSDCPPVAALIKELVGQL